MPPLRVLLLFCAFFRVLCRSTRVLCRSVLFHDVIRAHDCSRLKGQISRLYARLFRRSTIRAKQQINFKAIFKPSSAFRFLPLHFIDFPRASAPRSNFAAIRAFYWRGAFCGRYEPPKQKKQIMRARVFFRFDCFARVMFGACCVARARSIPDNVLTLSACVRVSPSCPLDVARPG